MKSKSVTIQKKAKEQCILMLLSIIHYEIVITLFYIIAGKWKRHEKCDASRSGSSANSERFAHKTSRSS